MHALRFGVCCTLVAWMAADARAQLGTYGAPDPISWSQDNLPAGNTPQVATRTTYVSAVDGSVTAQNIPAPPNAGIGPMLSQPGPAGAGQQEAAGYPGPAVPPANGQTTIMPPGGYMSDAGNCENGDNCGWGACGCCCSPWYASVESLYMSRSQPNTLFTSAQANALVNQGRFDTFNWTWGGQATLGYRFGCCCDWALEGTYWGLVASDTDGQPNIAGPYVTPMNMGLVDIIGTVGGSPNGNQSAADYFDNSPDHHIWREWEAQDLELNVVKNVCGGPCCHAAVDFLVGVRWLRFQDNLDFGAEHPFDGTIYGGDWIYLSDHITNDLVGLQAGFNASYRFLDCWRAFFRPVVGIYDNHMTLDYNLYAASSTTGQQFQGSSSTYANPNYPVHTTNDGFAFLTQVDVGLDWQITRHFSAQGGYRVIAATGMGLADEQVPFYGNDTQMIDAVQRNGSLILHGAFAGMTFAW